MTEHPRIEIHHAYIFDCDECGTENVVRAIKPHFEPGEEEEIKAEMGIQPWEDGGIEMAPEEATCKFCGAVYRLWEPPPDTE